MLRAFSIHFSFSYLLYISLLLPAYPLPISENIIVTKIRKRNRAIMNKMRNIYAVLKNLGASVYEKSNYCFQKSGEDTSHHNRLSKNVSE